MPKTINFILAKLPARLTWLSSEIWINSTLQNYFMGFRFLCFSRITKKMRMMIQYLYWQEIISQTIKFIYWEPNLLKKLVMILQAIFGTLFLNLILRKLSLLRQLFKKILSSEKKQTLNCLSWSSSNKEKNNKKES